MAGSINHVLTNIEGVLKGIGLASLIVGIMVGGLMRIFAFGNERRIAVSNVALSCAVVGFIIVMLASTAGQWLNGIVK